MKTIKVFYAPFGDARQVLKDSNPYAANQWVELPVCADMTGLPEAYITLWPALDETYDQKETRQLWVQVEATPKNGGAKSQRVKILFFPDADTEVDVWRATVERLLAEVGIETPRKRDQRVLTELEKQARALSEALEYAARTTNKITGREALAQATRLAAEVTALLGGARSLVTLPNETEQPSPSTYDCPACGGEKATNAADVMCSDCLRRVNYWSQQ